MNGVDCFSTRKKIQVALHSLRKNPYDFQSETTMVDLMLNAMTEHTGSSSTSDDMIVDGQDKTEHILNRLGRITGSEPLVKSYMKALSSDAYLEDFCEFLSRFSDLGISNISETLETAVTRAHSSDPSQSVIDNLASSLSTTALFSEVNQDALSGAFSVIETPEKKTSFIIALFQYRLIQKSRFEISKPVENFCSALKDVSAFLADADAVVFRYYADVCRWMYANDNFGNALTWLDQIIKASKPFCSVVGDLNNLMISTMKIYMDLNTLKNNNSRPATEPRQEIRFNENINELYLQEVNTYL